MLELQNGGSTMVEARRAPWFKNDPESLSSPARELLENYSGVPPTRVIDHVTALRDRALHIFPYPCLSNFSFLELGMIKLPCYNEIKERITSGEKFLDLGCCLGQEIRKLAMDGVPSNNMYGSDLSLDFANLGYELFQDRELLKCTFIEADVLNPESDLNALDGQLGIINAQSFFHLFTWDQQVQIAKRLVSMFQPTRSNLLTGRQIATRGAFKVVTHSAGSVYLHNIESWKRLWAEVGSATRTLWDVRVLVEPTDPDQIRSTGSDSYIMIFMVRRLTMA